MFYCKTGLVIWINHNIKVVLLSLMATHLSSYIYVRNQKYMITCCKSRIICPLNRNESGRFGALKSDSTHHFFRNACTKSGSLRFSQFSGCGLILSVYIIMSLYSVKLMSKTFLRHTLIKKYF
jgi:hypothetical protein